MPEGIARQVSGRRTGSPTAIKITDVADAAGVAPMTVSRVINTPDRVSAPTRIKVQAAIDKLGYVPNLIAGGLSSRRSRMVAAIVPTIASPMFAGPVQSFTDTLGAAGYRVMLALSGYDPAIDAELIRAVLARRPDALLLTGAQRSPAATRLLREAQVPVVEIWDAAETPTDMLVGFDHAELGAAVADYFINRGHSEFAVLAASDPRGMARADGFARRVRALGFPVHVGAPLPAPSGIADGRAGLRALAPQMRGRIALLCSSDLVAFGALTEAPLLGLAVPDQLAVCGFGNFEISQACEPPFTTVAVDGVAMGRIAAESLLRRLAGEPTETRVLVPFEILTRGST